MVTYGGMSRRPIKLPTGPFIFQDKTCRGFWMSSWYMNESKRPSFDPIKRMSCERTMMMQDLYRLIRSKKLSSEDVAVFPVRDHQAALKNRKKAVITWQ